MHYVAEYNSELHLPKCPTSSARKNKKGMPNYLRVAIPTTGALLLLLSGLVLAGFLYRKFKTAPKKEIPHQFAEIELPIVPYNDILNGTDRFSEANVWEGKIWYSIQGHSRE